MNGPRAEFHRLSIDQKSQGVSVRLGFLQVFATITPYTLQPVQGDSKHEFCYGKNGASASFPG
jgi:hypothetical protein